MTHSVIDFLVCACVAFAAYELGYINGGIDTSKTWYIRMKQLIDDLSTREEVGDEC